MICVSIKLTYSALSWADTTALAHTLFCCIIQRVFLPEEIFVPPTLANAKTTPSCYNGINYFLFTSITHLPRWQSSLPAMEQVLLLQSGIHAGPPSTSWHKNIRNSWHGSHQKPTQLSSLPSQWGEVTESPQEQLGEPWERQSLPLLGEDAQNQPCTEILGGMRSSTSPWNTKTPRHFYPSPFIFLCFAWV